MTDAAMASSEPSNRLNGRRWLNSQPRPIDQAKTSAMMSKSNSRIRASATGRLLHCIVPRAALYCSGVWAGSVCSAQTADPGAQGDSGRQRVMMMQPTHYGHAVHTKAV